MNYYDSPPSITMIAVSGVIVLACIISTVCRAPSYNVGDCLAKKDSNYVYKVIQTGTYGLKTVKPVYSGYEVVFQDSEDLKKAYRMDCFDLFDDYNNKGSK